MTDTDLSVALLTLGCARNEVDSEELAARLAEGGFRLVADAEDADTVVVNTCGFVEAAKKDSVDTLLQAADLKQDGRTRAVVAVGCLAERYGAELADLAARGRRRARLRRLPRHRRPAALDRGGGEAPPAHPAGPAPAAADQPGRAPEPSRREPAEVHRRRLDSGPMSPLKLASGCDRRCTFCAIPTFRGSFVSRRPSDVLAEARWLAEQGARELFLVSENSTSYGKDLGDLRLLETLLPEIAAHRRRRAGAGLLPAARRDPARADRGDRHDARGGGVLRPLLPARQPHRAAPDAPLRRPGELPRPARAGALARARPPASAPT